MNSRACPLYRVVRASGGGGFAGQRHLTPTRRPRRGNRHAQCGAGSQRTALLDIPLPTMLPTNMWPPPSQFALPPTEPSRETPPGMNMPAEGP
jgi:hypothetical protein